MLLQRPGFYETSHGGVTFSGGEPMQQADFLVELLPECKPAACRCLWNLWYGNLGKVEKVLLFVDLVLYDLRS